MPKEFFMRKIIERFMNRKEMSRFEEKYEKNKMEQPIMETRREDGTLVGREISKQRRWQIRNPEYMEKCRKKGRK